MHVARGPLDRPESARPRGFVGRSGGSPDGHLFMILSGMAVASPESLAVDDVFTKVDRQVWDEGWDTQPVRHLCDTLARADNHEGQEESRKTSEPGFRFSDSPDSVQP